jgi:hypothetical protein
MKREVKFARTREQKEKRTVLFAVPGKGVVFDSSFDWATEIRTWLPWRVVCKAEARLRAGAEV